MKKCSMEKKIIINFFVDSVFKRYLLQMHQIVPKCGKRKIIVMQQILTFHHTITSLNIFRFFDMKTLYEKGLLSLDTFVFMRIF